MATLLGELRALAPMRPSNYAEGLGIAEVQAQLLLRCEEVVDAPVPDRIVSEFPKVRVTRETRIPVSGASHWAAGDVGDHRQCGRGVGAPTLHDGARAQAHP